MDHARVPVTPVRSTTTQVPSLTEYVNAILFATRNNIALRCAGHLRMAIEPSAAR